jgi:hypothetical protein
MAQVIDPLPSKLMSLGLIPGWCGGERTRNKQTKFSVLHEFFLSIHFSVSISSQPKFKVN